jgi:hypothetical protein
MSQQNQYNQMLQQMMMNKQRPSPYSPAPYANGGNVALRRKMFKLGGSASAHGTGLTSGLEFNEGGSVKPGPDGKPRQHAILGGLLKLIRKPITKTIKDRDEILKILRAGGAGATGRGAVGRGIVTSTPPSFLRQLTRTGAGATPFAVASGLLGEAPDPFTEEEKSPAMRLIDTGRVGAELLSDLNPFALGAAALLQTPKLFDPKTKMGDIDLTLADALRSARGIEREKTVGEASQDQQENVLGKTIAQLQAEADVKQREDLQAAMEMYQELIRGEDNTNKLMTLGDAAIAAGSALMEGEGYGAAATAFNEPLAQARMTQAERDQAAQSAAAQLAIGEDMSRRQANEALFNKLASEGQLDSAEEIRNYMLAIKFGVSKRVPEDEKGELDLEAMKAAGPAVYVDPKVRLGGLFIAFDGEKYQRFNSAEEAQQYTES